MTAAIKAFPALRFLNIKGVKPNRLSYVIFVYMIFSLLMVVVFKVELLEQNALRYLIYTYTAITAAIFYTAAALLSFDAFRQYSSYGISHNHFLMNHLLSITVIALPFLSVFIATYFLIPAFLLLAYSFDRHNDQKSSVYTLNGFLMCVLFAIEYLMAFMLEGT